jgi:hypothetical protein
MALGLLAQFLTILGIPGRSWFSAIFFVLFSAGLILRVVAWKEERKKSPQSS